LSCQNLTAFSTNRRIHNARSKIFCGAKLCLPSTVDTALEIWHQLKLRMR
jgi:hypothetical protein